MTILPGILVGWVLFLCVGRAATAAGSRLVSGAPASVRWSAGILAAYWIATTLFVLLAAARLFHPLAALGAAAVLALASGASPARWRESLHGLGAGARAASRAAAASPLPLRLALGAGALVVAARFARAAVAPPLCWDALTYHLVKAALWVQGRGVLAFEAPDAWEYYRDFPPGGDLLWAWAMLPTRSDLLLAPANALVWFSTIPPAYAAARALGAPQGRAWVAALAIAFTPAAIGYFAASYVDTLSLALFLFLALFVIRASRAEPAAGDVILGCAAAGLAAGVKVSAAPIALVGLALLLGRALLARRFALAGAGLLAAATPLVPAIAMWAREGSPFFPFALRIGGRALAPGNEQLSLLLAGVLQPERFSWGEFFGRLFLPLDWAGGKPHVNLGPGCLLLIPLAVAGAAGLVSRRQSRSATVFLLIAALLTVLPLLSPDAIAIRTTWARQSGRFLLPAVGALALLGAQASGRAARPAWGLLLAAHLLLAVPFGWGPADARALGDLLLAAGLPALAGAIAALALARRGKRRLAGALLASLAVAVPWAIAGVRDRHRDPIYADAATGRAFDVRPLSPQYAAPQPIWSRLGAGSPRVIAVTAGWDAMGHNWYLYPLLGRGLQNRIVYVPPSRDGEIPETRERVALDARLDRDRWLARLDDSGAELVVALPPEPVEVRWMGADPEHFELAVRGRDGFGSAFRFTR